MKNKLWPALAVWMGVCGQALSSAAAADISCAVVSHFVRVTAAGDRIEGAMFLPKGSDRRPGAPFPIFILSHGFSRDYGRHMANAASYACAGIITYTPNVVPVDEATLEKAHQIDNLIDHVRWLRQRASDPGDPLYGVGDPERIALGGHSAGAAISVEAAVRVQGDGADIDALVLLDAVPDLETLEAAAKLTPLPVVSIRSRPGPCNAYGSGKALEDAIPFQVESFFFPWATHCDPESPTDVVCRVLCGGSSEQGRTAYQQQTLEFLHRLFFGAEVPEL